MCPYTHRVYEVTITRLVLSLWLPHGNQYLTVFQELEEGIPRVVKSINKHNEEERAGVPNNFYATDPFSNSCLHHKIKYR